MELYTLTIHVYNLYVTHMFIYMLYNVYEAPIVNCVYEITDIHTVYINIYYLYFIYIIILFISYLYVY